MSNIVLIGFMGSGKSTIGKKIANKKDMKFIDMDFEIEKLENKTISEIFKDYGEIYFREKETELLKKVLTSENAVISTGGGIIENKENRGILHKEENVIWLYADAEKIIKNIKHEIYKRPKLMEAKNLEEYIEKLLKSRHSKYKEVSNIKVNTNNKNIDEVMSDILVYI
ncbi:shikimate kinase [Paraclostridium bifermentans]|uniref:shikimate kinase n=1 Tax=Paraclostridium bifermentans TaxID=1490 RepID=UPI00359C5263